MNRYDVAKGKKIIIEPKKGLVKPRPRTKEDREKFEIIDAELETISKINNLGFNGNSTTSKLIHDNNELENHLNVANAKENQRELIEESKKLRQIKDKSPNTETTLISDVAENFEDFSKLNENGTDEAWIASFEKLTSDEAKEDLEQAMSDLAVVQLEILENKKGRFIVAIDGKDTYFKLRTWNDTLYTRKGLFNLSPKLKIVFSEENYELLPLIDIPEDAIDFNIKSKGEVEVLIYKDGIPEWVEIGQIQLFKFDHPEKLEKYDSVFYKKTLGSGEPIEVNLLNQYMLATKL
jgi:hypothetical protein